MSRDIHPDDVERLRRSHLFSGFEDSQFREIMARSAGVSLDAGQTLFNQGDQAEAFYWVGEGLVRLFRASPQGEEKVVELVAAGRFFAEAAVFMGCRYPVSAVAQVPCRLVAIDAAGFRAWLGQDTDRCFRLLAVMSAKMHKLVEDIDRLTLLKGTDRLWRYLLDRSEPDAEGRLVVHLEAPKQVVASHIGVKPETLSRLLHKLSDAKLIELREHRIYIPDPEASP